MVKDPIRSHEAVVGAEALLRATGQSREAWFARLDEAGATSWTHGPIASWLVEQGVDPWWAQSVTVGYEQARGMRVPGQRPDGSFEANVTRTLPVPTDEALRWLTEPAARQRWLDVEPELRSATAVRSVRWGWPDGGRVTLQVLPAPGGRTRLSVRHRTADADAVAALKREWSDRLDRLQAALTEPAGGA